MATMRRWRANIEGYPRCQLCVERIDGGLKSACVNVSPSYCVYFGDINEVTKRIGEQRLLV